jgi:hypothetical protein
MSIGDLMAILMFVFLLISVTHMVELNKIDQMAEIKEKFNEELKKNLEEYKEEFHFRIEENAIIFDRNESVYFESNKSCLTDIQQDSFYKTFPLLLKTALGFKDNVYEITVMGFASPTCSKIDDPDECYLYNLKISRQRAENTLRFCYGMGFEGDVDVSCEKNNRVYSKKVVQDEKEWLRLTLKAVAASSSQLKYDDAKKVDEDGSRRVAFRVILKPKGEVQERLTGGAGGR